MLAKKKKEKGETFIGRGQGLMKGRNRSERTKHKQEGTNQREVRPVRELDWVKEGEP